MDKSVDGEELAGGELARRWAEAGRVIERLSPQLFAAMVAAAEATAVEISPSPSELIS